MDLGIELEIEIELEIKIEIELERRRERVCVSVCACVFESFSSMTNGVKKLIWGQFYQHFSGKLLRAWIPKA